MRRSHQHPVAVLLLLLLQGSPAAGDDVEAAKEEFRLGKNDYLEGRYEDAIRHYQKAMSLKPSAKLHYNIGLAHEKLGQPSKALESYRAYLVGEPGAANAEEVRQRIANLEKHPGPTAPAPVLVVPRSAPPRPPPPARPGIDPEQPNYQTVVVTFGSTPMGASLVVDGRALGPTPLSLAVVAGGSYRVQMTKAGYLPETASIVVRPGQPVWFDLKRSAEGRLRAMTRTEWFSLLPVVGMQSENFAFGLRLSAVGLRWRYFYWTIIELGGHLGPYPAADIGTQLGFPFYLGAQGQHQLRVGLGVGYGTVDKLNSRSSDWTTKNGMLLSPSLEYRYQGPRRFFFGAGVRYAGMVVGSGLERDRPHAVLLAVPMGWTALE